MGIGLGVDYGLFVTYRFREELAAGRTVDGAVRAAVAHAGRTVAFSGATVAASVAVLFAFPFPFLSSFAYAGIAVVATAVVGAVVVLPALLRLLGRRALPRRGVVSRAPEDGFWFRTAARVMRRPVLAGGAGLLVLVLLGAPAVAIDFGSPDDRVLPSSQPIRAMYDTIRADFATEEADVIQVVAPRAAATDVADYAAELSRIGGVQRVDSAAGAFAGGLWIGEPEPNGPARFTSSDGGTWLSVLPTGTRLADDPTGLVAEVRALLPPSPVLVGGYPAELADYRDSLVERLPLVGVLIVLVTFIVLFLMTGSVVAPLKASVLNLLSLSVMFGVLVWGFQDGGLAGLLGFTPTGVIEPSIPILMFCIAYGLSMDYEVFLLARIKADADRTGDVLGSVPRGIARSGATRHRRRPHPRGLLRRIRDERGHVPPAARHRHGARRARRRHRHPWRAGPGRDAAGRQRQLVGARCAAARPRTDRARRGAHQLRPLREESMSRNNSAVLITGAASTATADGHPSGGTFALVSSIVTPSSSRATSMESMHA